MRTFLAREVQVNLRDESSDVFSVATKVRDSLFGFSDGTAIADWYRSQLPALAPRREGHPTEKLLSSVSHLDILGLSNAKVRDFATDQIVNLGAVKRHRASLETFMKTSLRSRGVMGGDYDSFAEEFAQNSECRLSANLGPNHGCTAREFMARLLHKTALSQIRLMVT